MNETMETMTIIVILIVFVIGVIIWVLGYMITVSEIKDEYRKKNYLEHEIVRYYSLCTGNLTKPLIYNTLEESEIFVKIVEGEDSNISVMTNLLLIVEELKRQKDYKKELDAVTEEKLQAICLTEKMLIEKGVKSQHRRKKINTDYIWNYWVL
ncbi:hypothetical protein [Pseudobutyrivibrio sp. LB2011]|uniref:hypothetical protein n=1 Tax=Pseudobutyrivibrio sp. LB2011 TaxID=1408312 RepID=UPI0005D20FA2|nr:hypothetical protein [Pseudobutyrivibrio sp. LB2011]